MSEHMRHPSRSHVVAFSGEPPAHFGAVGGTETACQFHRKAQAGIQPRTVFFFFFYPVPSGNWSNQTKHLSLEQVNYLFFFFLTKQLQRKYYCFLSPAWM